MERETSNSPVASGRETPTSNAITGQSYLAQQLGLLLEEKAERPSEVIEKKKKEKERKEHHSKHKKDKTQKGDPSTSSKYDYIKIKVWLGDHYYVFSRFLVSRVLTTTQVPFRDAVRITLDLKRTLVDKGTLKLTQGELEQYLFQIMADHGYGNAFRNRFAMMSTMYHKRVPLIIMITGTGCLGKSFLATLFAERMNLPNVLQTSLVLEFMEIMSQQHRMGKDEISSTPLLYRKTSSTKEFLDEYKRECSWVKKGIETDIEKAFSEGKALLIEGTHLDPELFLDLIHYHNLVPPSCSPSVPLAKEDQAKITSKTGVDISKKGIIIPILFNLSESDHLLFVENSLKNRGMESDILTAQLGTNAEEKANTLLTNMRVIQNHLTSFAPPFEVININAAYFMDCVDILQSHVLALIQKAYDDTSGFKV